MATRSRRFQRGGGRTGEQHRLRINKLFNHFPPFIQTTTEDKHQGQTRFDQYRRSPQGHVKIFSLLESCDTETDWVKQIPWSKNMNLGSDLRMNFQVWKQPETSWRPTTFWFYLLGLSELIFFRQISRVNSTENVRQPVSLELFLQWKDVTINLHCERRCKNLKQISEDEKKKTRQNWSFDDLLL